MTWDEVASTWDEGVAQRGYADAAYESLQRHLLSFKLTFAGAHVCDFGCGTGLLTEKIVGECGKIDAVDSSAAMLQVLKAKVGSNGWRNVSALAKVPLEGPEYDFVLCSSVCGFLDDYTVTVRQLVQRMRPGGLFAQWDWELNPKADDPTGLSRDAIVTCLEGAGLERVCVDTAFTITAEDRTMSPLLGIGRKPE